MKIDINQSVGQFVIELTDAAAIFEKFKVSYYPENEKSLEQACSEAAVSCEKVAEELGKSEELPSEWLSRAPDLTGESMASVIRYLIHVHHHRTRNLLDNIGELISRLKGGGHEPQRLEVVGNIFEKVNVEIRHHMLEEERTIFPYLVFAERLLAKGDSEGRANHREKRFKDSIRDILFEHRFMDKNFAEIKKLVYLFRDGRGARELEPLEKTLKELADDNERHVLLENNVLLQRAAQLGLMD